MPPPRRARRTCCLGPVHLEQDELPGVPQFVGEVAVSCYPIQGQIQVLAGPGACIRVNQVGPVFDLGRSVLLSADQCLIRVDQYCPAWRSVGFV